MLFLCKNIFKHVYTNVCPFFFIKSKIKNIFIPNFVSYLFYTFTFGFSCYYLKNTFKILFTISDKKNENSKQVKQIIQIPYEEKYVEEFNNLSSKSIQCIVSNNIFKEQYNKLILNYKQELYALQEEYAELKTLYDNSESDDEDNDLDFENDEPIKLLLEKIYKIKNILKDDDKIIKETKNIIFDIEKEKFMVSLHNNFIIEFTPVGNVIMVYNTKKEGFSYYSDKSISNKYLETVCRKYCIQFNCKLLFNNVYINEGKLSNFSFLKNEEKQNIKKNSKLRFSDFKKQFALF